MSELVPYLPEDFDAFWAEAVAEAYSVKLDYRRSNTNDFALPGYVVETISFQGKEFVIHGWIAYPEGNRRSPGFVWIPPYGRESLLPNQYGTRDGFCSLSFNFHGESSFHQEKYVTERGYFSVGAEDPEKWIFRRMLQDAIVATRVLQAQIEVDEERIGAMGLSQGGGMAIWLGAHCPIIKTICADLPFLSGIQHTLLKTVYRYPLKELRDFMDDIPLGEARVLNTVSYFDTMNHATRCMVPSQVSYGLKDPACRAEAVRATYDALPGKKNLLEYDWGHDWHPDMVDANRRWMLENLG